MSSILFIAPYQRMAFIAKKAAASLHLELDVEVASDFDCVRAVTKHPDARVAVSRGGTSKVLRGIKNLAVVDVEASFFEMLQAVTRLIERGCGGVEQASHKIVVVTHDNIIGLEQGIIKLSNAEIVLSPCKTAEEIISTVEDAIAQGAGGIVGCVVAVDCARRKNIPSEFIDSDFFSVKQALIEAVNIENSLKAQDLMLNRMNSLLHNIEEGAVIFGEDGNPLLYNDIAAVILKNRPISKWKECLLDSRLRSDRSPAVINIDDRKVLVRNIDLNDSGGNNRVVIMQDGNLIERSSVAMKISAYEHGLYAKTYFKDIVYASQIMQDTIDLAMKFAVSDSTVLILGETGVGKEGFAQSIHNASLRASKPFVSVNCSSLPEGLVGSELFGYVEGAFTGARKSGKKGLFELANGGTIFLDEITEVPLDIQSQLLRVIQEREVMRIGGDKMIPLDIRIICAGNRDILALCKAGKFRFDLYYRLNVLRLKVPPLRFRGGDILILFKKFMADFLHVNESDIILDEEAVDLIERYDWPGNVRELRNVAEASSFFGHKVQGGRLVTLFESLAVEPAGDSPLILNLPRNPSLEQVSLEYLKYLLKSHSVKETSAIAKISRTSLWRKLRKFQEM